MSTWQNQAVCPILAMPNDATAGRPPDNFIGILANLFSDPIPILSIPETCLRSDPTVMPEGRIAPLALFEKEPPAGGHVFGTGFDPLWKDT